MAKSIEEIAKSTPYEDYSYLRNELAILNSNLKNTITNIRYDPTDVSYRAVSRTDNQRAGINKYFKKNSFFGVIIAVKKGKHWFSDETYYVDVPGWNNTIQVVEPENIATFIAGNDDDSNKEYEILVFQNRIGGLLCPKVGSIVEVKVPENYPNHLDTNKQDAEIIKDIKIKNTPAYKVNTKIKKTDTSSGYSAQNGGDGNVQLGNANISYSWALTAQGGPAPENLGATELKAINTSKSIFDKITKQNLMSPYSKIVSSVSTEFNIASFYINSIIAIESTFNPNARSPTGAGGLMQLTQIAIDDAIQRGKMDKKYPQVIGSDGKPSYSLIKSDPQLNIWAGTFGFKMWYNKYNGDILRASGAYNGGSSGNNKGIGQLNWNQIRTESLIYIFKYNAMVNFMKSSVGLTS